MSAPRPSGTAFRARCRPLARPHAGNLDRIGVVGEGEPVRRSRPPAVSSGLRPASSARARPACARTCANRANANEPAARRSNRGEPIPRRAAVRVRPRIGRCSAWPRPGERRCRPGQPPSRAGHRERRSSTWSRPAPRPPARGSRGSGATRRRTRAHGMRAGRVKPCGSRRRRRRSRGSCSRSAWSAGSSPGRTRTPGRGRRGGR